MSKYLSLVLLLSVVVEASACTPQGDPAISPEGFVDDFNRDQLGELWKNTGGPWEIRDGMLHVRGAKNKPLWLRRSLPRNARFEFDVKSTTPDGDIKFEIYGDGESKAVANKYVATSYVLVFGAHSNSHNMIARLDEHSQDRVSNRKRKVEIGKMHHFVAERKGNLVVLKVDGEELIRMDDPEPLWGTGHQHFSFNNWQSELWFDNLKITPL